MISPIALAAAAAFNLICSGQSSTGLLVGGYLTAVKTEQFRDLYRVDLNLQRWCEGECNATAPIQNTTETTLTVQEDTAMPTASVLFIINRESGAMVRRSQTGSFVAVRIGNCQPASFTGFPARKF